MTARAWLRGGLSLVAVAETLVGLWQTLLPEHFFGSFPAAAHAWVAALPPYNEHLLRDQGGMHLTTAVIFAAAALTMDRWLVRIAPLANLAFALPHLIFHATHLDALSPGDAAAQTLTLLASVLLPAALLALSRSVPRPSG
ncbi:hypothetical protein ABT294_09395 [Nonomuraea sp. NPDC000554]|uniref:hypothetical protein n=1 Tax=Nonomuraea sp. NPDC000554 TaxID=3154259 RepID=UPI003318036F